ncbi:MAG TPA: STAS domain-containing protein [Solirubrobacteraceae bacterium]|nr:STAS domain-containing protein [Solirubrobacteraceae bacterium]
MTDAPSHFALSVIALDEHAVRIEVTGEIDLVSAPEFSQALSRRIATGKNVVLDFSRTVFMDSSGIRALVNAIHQCEDHGSTLVVTGELPHQVRRLFEITRIEAALAVVRS